MAKTDFEETLSLADIQELTVHCAGGFARSSCACELSNIRNVNSPAKKLQAIKTTQCPIKTRYS